MSLRSRHPKQHLDFHSSGSRRESAQLTVVFLLRLSRKMAFGWRAGICAEVLQLRWLTWVGGCHKEVKNRVGTETMAVILARVHASFLRTPSK